MSTQQTFDDDWCRDAYEWVCASLEGIGGEAEALASELRKAGEWRGLRDRDSAIRTGVLADLTRTARTVELLRAVLSAPLDDFPGAMSAIRDLQTDRERVELAPVRELHGGTDESR
jgi:hypothetical protein